MAYFSGIECDNCGDTVAWNGTLSKMYLNKWAREKGWTIGKRCLCPKCNLKKIIEKHNVAQ